MCACVLGWVGQVEGLEAVEPAPWHCVPDEVWGVLSYHPAASVLRMSAPSPSHPNPEYLLPILAHALALPPLPPPVPPGPRLQWLQERPRFLRGLMLKAPEDPNVMLDASAVPKLTAGVGPGSGRRLAGRCQGRRWGTASRGRGRAWLSERAWCFYFLECVGACVCGCVL